MSMTREEAVRQLSDLRDHCRSMISGDNDYPEWALDVEALDMAITALRPVSRERVEKAWRGCRSCKSCRSCAYSVCDLKDMPCKKCGPNAEGIVSKYKPRYKPSNFCPVCGKPLTDEAVEMMMQRLEKIK